ncbi:MAG TPA: PhzF family phenazine biosynthesis protein [bacterium]|nr:PhzF family phenazine biosynthesis protein [bacterium]HQG45797.1 PhzF family phenazine biosynthesis protein [bacterium]HQI48085.1 PhzF family phenazine biosynthesis protein [bacterium]HQJ63730.1 PhzF family phenazine biosynthesis protein [bacterium]
MKIPLYQVDAFSSAVFSGNPAAVCLLNEWLEDALLQAIAAENNLSETAFLVPDGEGCEIRWFTPVTEVALCGHATLASAYVQLVLRGWPEETIRFKTRKSGSLLISRRNDLLEMDFPARPPRAQATPAGLDTLLGVEPLQVFSSAEDLLVLVRDEQCVLTARPDFTALAEAEPHGIIITARGSRSDFVSRFFAPALGVPEDPVTGSAHCVLTPYWAEILGKKELHALQISKRGGELWCRDAGDRVRISGRAALFLEGFITI